MGLSTESVKTGRRAGKRAMRGVARAQENHWVQAAQRFGYVVRGVLYGAMGLLALAVAVSHGSRLVDQAGGLWIVSHAPLGRVTVAAFLLGLCAYSAWGFVRAAYDPLRRGDGAPGLVNRLGWAWSGTSYAMLAIFALRLTLGQAGPPRDPVGIMAERLLLLPGGGLVTLLAGLFAMGAGLAQFVDAYWARWHRDLRRSRMTDAERTATLWLGRAGLVSRGVVFTTVGWLLVAAGCNSDPTAAHGYAGAFRVLSNVPAGRLWLALVALGFVALGLHSLACAKWIRLVKS